MRVFALLMEVAPKMGGNGEEVQIDEMLARGGKRKNNKGRRTRCDKEINDEKARKRAVTDEGFIPVATLFEDDLTDDDEVYFIHFTG